MVGLRNLKDADNNDDDGYAAIATANDGNDDEWDCSH